MSSETAVFSFAVVSEAQKDQEIASRLIAEA